MCFGGTGGMVIDIDNPAATNYSYLVGYYATPTFFVSQFSAALTTGLQQSPNGFNANVDYFVRLVDSTAYYNGNSGSPNGQVQLVYMMNLAQLTSLSPLN